MATPSCGSWSDPTSAATETAMGVGPVPIRKGSDPIRPDQPNWSRRPVLSPKRSAGAPIRSSIDRKRLAMGVFLA